MYLKEIPDLDLVLNKVLAHRQTTTFIVHSSPVPLRSLPIGDTLRFLPVCWLPFRDRYERVARNSGEIDKVEGRARWIAKRWRGLDAARHSILRAFAGLLGAFACFEDSVAFVDV